VLSWQSDQIAALNYVNSVRSTQSIASVNMSLGGGQYFSACDSSAPQTSIINTLRANNVAVVIAAGNDGFDDSVGSPGCISAAITVGSSTKSDVRSSFSNWGSLIDVVAPGSSIYASYTNNGNIGYSSLNGTSMATPHVAGAWAALRSAVPSATVSQIETALENTGLPISSASTTKPRIRVDQALAALGGGSGTASIVSAVTPVARRAVVGQTVTTFASVISLPSSTGTATNCTIARPADGLPYTFSYAERLLPGTGLGPLNAPFTLTPGQARHFFLSFNTTGVMSSNLRLVFDCSNSDPAPVALGLNSFNLVVTAAAGADVIATAVTTTGDGIMYVPRSSGGINFFAAAGLNIGPSSTLQVRISSVAIGSSSAPLPILLEMCQTNPSTGACLAPRSSGPLNVVANTNQAMTFAGFATYQGTALPLDPANRRVFFHFFEGSTSVGSASIAVTTDSSSGGSQTASREGSATTDSASVN